jgi:hypothetical protein
MRLRFLYSQCLEDNKGTQANAQSFSEKWYVKLILKKKNPTKAWGDVKPSGEVCFDFRFLINSETPLKTIHGRNIPCSMVERCVIERYGFST